MFRRITHHICPSFYAACCRIYKKPAYLVQESDYIGSIFVKTCRITIIWDWLTPTVVAGQRIGAKEVNDGIHEESERAETKLERLSGCDQINTQTSEFEQIIATGSHQ
jgi:hypothetical protein